MSILKIFHICAQCVYFLFLQNFTFPLPVAVSCLSSVDSNIHCLFPTCTPSAPSAPSCDAPVPRFTFSSPPVAGCWQAPPPVARQPVSVAAWPAWLGRPFNASPQRIAWHRRVESRSPAPAPLSPLFAMPCPAQLDSAIENCILHCTDAAPSLHRNARRCSLAAQCNALDPLYWPAAALLSHANKIPRSGGRARPQPVQGWCR